MATSLNMLWYSRPGYSSIELDKVKPTLRKQKINKIYGVANMAKDRIGRY